MVKSYEKRIGKKEKTGEPIMGTFWEFRVRFIDDDGKEKQKHLGNFKSESSCKKAMFSFLASKGGNTKREGLNFEYQFSLYKEHAWRGLRPNTIETNTYWFEGHILPYFRNYLVCNITVEDVMDFQNKLRENYSDNTIKNITAQLKSFMNYCAMTGKIEKTPFDRRRTSIQVKNKKTAQIWSLDDFMKFIQYYDNDIDKKTLYFILFYTGMRVEEVLALEKQDFDFLHHSLRIRRTYQRVRGKDYLEETTKTESSNRTIPLCSDLEEVIQVFFDCHPELNKDERIFPYTQRRVYDWLQIGCNAQNMIPTHPHALRNSLITNAVSEGCTYKAVQKIVGHSSVRTTMDVYAQSLKEDEIEVGNLYNKPKRVV